MPKFKKNDATVVRWALLQLGAETRTDEERNSCEFWFPAMEEPGQVLQPILVPRRRYLPPVSVITDILTVAARNDYFTEEAYKAKIVEGCADSSPISADEYCIIPGLKT